MLHEVLYIWSEFGMVHKPVIQSSVAAQEEGGGQKQQRRSGKYRQEYPQDCQSQGYQSKYCQKYLHRQFLIN